MSHLRRHMSLAVLLLSLISGTRSWGVEDLRLRDWVLADYPKALEALESRYSRIEGRGVMRYLETVKPKRREAKSFGVEFKSAPNRRVFRRFAPVESLLDVSVPASESISSLFGRYPETVLLLNPDYSATLVKPSDQSDFSIEALDPGPDDSRRKIGMSKSFLLDCAITAEGLPIDRLMKIEGFRLVRVERERAEEGLDRVRIIYSIIRDGFPKNAAVALISGWLIVDPTHQWILHEYGSVFSYKSGLSFTNVGRMKYNLTDPGQPKPISSANYQYGGRHDHDPVRDDPSLKPESGEDFQFLDVQFGDIPERNFTLSAFGLPEFNQQITPRPTGSKAPWWIFGVSAIALGVAIIAWRLGSRSKSFESR